MNKAFAYFKIFGLPFTGKCSFFSLSIITLRLVFVSSNVIINKSLSLVSCFVIPSILFTTLSICLAAPHGRHPGTFNCTTFSAANATPHKDMIKIKPENTLNIFFIVHLCLYVKNYLYIRHHHAKNDANYVRFITTVVSNLLRT